MPSSVLLAAGFRLKINDIEFNSLGRTRRESPAAQVGGASDKTLRS